MVAMATAAEEGMADSFGVVLPPNAVSACVHPDSLFLLVALLSIQLKYLLECCICFFCPLAESSDSNRWSPSPLTSSIRLRLCCTLPKVTTYSVVHRLELCFLPLSVARMQWHDAHTLMYFTHSSHSYLEYI